MKGACAMVKDLGKMFCGATLGALLATIFGAVFPAAREIANAATIYFVAVGAIAIALCVVIEIFNFEK